jgi:hypothetical protein
MIVSAATRKVSTMQPDEVNKFIENLAWVGFIAH